MGYLCNKKKTTFRTHKPKYAASVKFRHYLAAPVIAMFIASWLLFQHWQDKGIQITIDFQSASGLSLAEHQSAIKALM